MLLGHFIYSKVHSIYNKRKLIICVLVLQIFLSLLNIFVFNFLFFCFNFFCLGFLSKLGLILVFKIISESNRLAFFHQFKNSKANSRIHQSEVDLHCRRSPEHGLYLHALRGPFDAHHQPRRRPIPESTGPAFAIRRSEFTENADFVLLGDPVDHQLYFRRERLQFAGRIRPFFEQSFFQ